MTIQFQAAFAATPLSCSCAEVAELARDFENHVIALHPALLAFARRLTKQDCDAEDLVQDTVVKALAAQHLFQEGTNLQSWLFTIMRNSFNTRWRKARREVVTGPEVIELAMTTPATQETSLWAQQAADRLLHDLSPPHRDILILIPVQGVSYEDAALICNCSVGTVKSRLSRARAALAALVGGKIS